tara:strand:+ start:1651 stop:2187 length:537 start_codon:yes stop_codon:yes gene_type:complete
MKNKHILANQEDVNKMVFRISNEIVESSENHQDFILIGIKTRGEFLSARIKKNIDKILNFDTPMGTIDITFHRDDFSNKFLAPKLGPSVIPYDLTDKNIILIDDVLYSGRTIRAAIEEIFSFGRPKSIKLAVLVDRGHRELPIRPDFVGKNYPTKIEQHITVNMLEFDGKDEIAMVNK